MEEIKKIITVDVKGDETVKSLKQHISELRDALLNVEKGSEDYGKITDELVESQKRLTDVMSIGKNTANAAEGSYNALVNEMKALKTVWREVGDDAERARLGDRIKEINDQLKDMDESIGNYQRNVGNYKSVWDTTQGELIKGLRKINPMLENMGKTILQLGKNMKTAEVTFKGAIKGMKAAMASFALTAILLAATEAIRLLWEWMGKLKDKLVEILPWNKKAAEETARLTAEYEKLKTAVNDTLTELDHQYALKEVWAKTDQDRLELMKEEQQDIQNIIELRKQEADIQEASIALTEKNHKRMSKYQKEQLEKEKEKLKLQRENIEAYEKRYEEMGRKIELTNEKIKASAAGIGSTPKKQKEEKERDYQKEYEKVLNDISSYYDLYISLEDFFLDSTNKNNKKWSAIRDDFNAKSKSAYDAADDIRKIALAEAESDYKKGVITEEQYAKRKLKIEEDYQTKASEIYKKDKVAPAFINIAQSIEFAIGAATDKEKEFNEAVESGLYSEEDLFEQEKNMLAARVNFWKQALKEINLNIEKYGDDLPETYKENILTYVKNMLGASRTELNNFVAQTKPPISEYKKAVSDLNENQFDLNRLEISGKQYTQEYKTLLNKRLDLLKVMLDNMYKLEGESDEEFLNRKRALILEIEDLQNYLNGTNGGPQDAGMWDVQRVMQWCDIAQSGLSAVSNSLSEIASGWSALAQAQYEAGEISQAEYERQLENLKALQVAQIVVNTISGAIGAVTQAVAQLGPIAGPIVGGIQAAAITAAGVAQIAAVKKQKVGSSSLGSSGNYGAALAQPVIREYDESYITNSTGLSETTMLANALTEQPLKAFVVESEMTAAQEVSRQRDKETTF